MSSEPGLRVGRWASALLAAALVASGCAPTRTTETPAPGPAASRAVVIVSGGGATTPFTTPTQACKDGDGFLSAGNTATGLRDHLLNAGKQVFTAPTMAGWGTVAEPDPKSFGPFSGCPTALPESMTIMATGDISAGGERLARFLGHLHTKYGITDVDLVGHSNGGLWSRSAIWVLKHTDDPPVTVRSLTTLGTPHEGSVPGRYTWNEIGIEACMGDAFCEAFNKAWVPYAEKGDKGINREDTVTYLNGPDGWNAAQGDALQDIPVTLIGGTYFDKAGGDPTVWPYDGIVSRSSAWASSLPDSVIPHRTCWSGPLTHSIFVSDFAKSDWSTAMTWNKDALERVNQAIENSATALSQPTRRGC